MLWDSVLAYLKQATNIYLFKFNNRNTRKMCEICSKLIIKSPERQRHQFTPFSSVSFVDFEQVNFNREKSFKMNPLPVYPLLLEK